MSDLKALVAGLFQRPGLLRDVVANPRELARLAGLGESQLGTLDLVSCAVSDVMSRIGCPSESSSSGGPTAPPTALVNRDAESGRRAGDGVALTGILSLLVVAGSLAAVGTVSLVALAGSGDRDA